MVQTFDETLAVAPPMERLSVKGNMKEPMKLNEKTKCGKNTIGFAAEGRYVMAEGGTMSSHKKITLCVCNDPPIAALVMVHTAVRGDQKGTMEL